MRLVLSYRSVQDGAQLGALDLHSATPKQLRLHPGILCVLVILRHDNLRLDLGSDRVRVRVRVRVSIRVRVRVRVRVWVWVRVRVALFAP